MCFESDMVGWSDVTSKHESINDWCFTHCGQMCRPFPRSFQLVSLHFVQLCSWLCYKYLNINKGLLIFVMFNVVQYFTRRYLTIYCSTTDHVVIKLINTTCTLFNNIKLFLLFLGLGH